MEKIFPIFVLIILCLKSELTNFSLVYFHLLALNKIYVSMKSFAL